MLEGVWPQTGVRIDLTGSGPPSSIQGGPRESDFRGHGHQKRPMMAQNEKKNVKLWKISLFYTPQTRGLVATRSGVLVEAAPEEEEEAAVLELED